MIGWLVAVGIYALGARSLHKAAEQQDLDEHNISHGEMLVATLGWPIFELLALLGIIEEDTHD